MSRLPESTADWLARGVLPTAPTTDLVGPTAQRVDARALHGPNRNHIHIPVPARTHALGDAGRVAVYATPNGIVLIPLDDDPQAPTLDVAGDTTRDLTDGLAQYDPDPDPDDDADADDDAGGGEGEGEGDPAVSVGVSD